MIGDVSFNQIRVKSRKVVTIPLLEHYGKNVAANNRHFTHNVLRHQTNLKDCLLLPPLPSLSGYKHIDINKITINLFTL